MGFRVQGLGSKLLQGGYVGGLYRGLLQQLLRGILGVCLDYSSHGHNTTTSKTNPGFLQLGVPGIRTMRTIIVLGSMLGSPYLPVEIPSIST